MDETLLQRPGVGWLITTLRASVVRWLRPDLVGDNVNHVARTTVTHVALVSAEPLVGDATAAESPSCGRKDCH